MASKVTSSVAFSIEEMDQKGAFTKVHIISVISEKYSDFPEWSEKIDEIILKTSVPAGAEVGDLIVEQNVAGYRSDGVYIVGHCGKIISLSDEPDDYGTLPKEFRIWKFVNTRTGKKVNHDYWHGALARDTKYNAGWHNNMVYFDPSDFNLHFGKDDVFRANVYGEQNYATALKLEGNAYLFSQEDNMEREKFLERMNTPGYIEMSTDDAKKKYRTNFVVFRVLRPSGPKN